MTQQETQEDTVLQFNHKEATGMDGLIILTVIERFCCATGLKIAVMINERAANRVRQQRSEPQIKH